MGQDVITSEKKSCSPIVEHEMTITMPRGMNNVEVPAASVLGKVDAMVLEIADGVFQDETAALLSGETFRNMVGGIVLAAGDSMGAAAGYEWLRKNSFDPLALSGVLTAAPR